MSQGAVVGGAVGHTRNQLEAAVRAKRSIEAIELIPEVSNVRVYMYVHVSWKGVVAHEWAACIMVCTCMKVRCFHSITSGYSVIAWCVCVCMCARVCVRVCVYVHVCACVCVRVCVHVCVTIQCISTYLAHMNNVYIHYISCSTAVVLIWRLADLLQSPN